MYDCSNKSFISIIFMFSVFISLVRAIGDTQSLQQGNLNNVTDYLNL